MLALVTLAVSLVVWPSVMTVRVRTVVVRVVALTLSPSAVLRHELYLTLPA
jgi:hypothetical protein